MDIVEIKNKKKALEVGIDKLVNDFCKEISTSYEHIEIDINVIKMIDSTHGEEEIISAKTKVKLKI